MLTQSHLDASVYAPIEPELQRVIGNLQEVAAEEAETLSADESIGQRLEHVLAAPGKRVRPAITLLASRLWGEMGNELAITMATAVELLHIATLVHDDTVDRADVRRGRATASSLWGDRVAVLLGDYLFAASARFVCDTGNIRVVRRFAETIMELSKGELTEVLAPGQPVPSRHDYEERIYNKTASLFSTAAESGAVLAGGPEEASRDLRDFGYNVGMAYQVMDDVLDFSSTADDLGKPACNDLRQGVLTLPSIVFLERYPHDNPLRHLFSASADDADLYIQRAAKQIRSCGILEECARVADAFVEHARSALRSLPNSEARTSLMLLAKFAGSRNN